MNMSEIKELSTQEIAERIVDQKEFLAKLRLNHTISPLDNPQKLSEARKVIARLKTELRQRK